MLNRYRRSLVRFLAVSGFSLAFSGLVWSQTTATPASQTRVPAANSGSAASQNIATATQIQLEHAALTHLIESIEPYYKKKDFKGTAVLSGSTTMMAMGKSWSDRFRNFHPDVVFTRGTDGTDAGIKSLSEDATVIAGASRPLTDADIAMLKKGKCKDPLSIIVALDPLAMYVHKDNPIRNITPEQLESVFRAAGGQGKHAATWGDVGVTGEFASKPIRIHARSETSGTAAFIKQIILGNAPMAKEAQIHNTNEEVCTAIGADIAGVGICGFGEATDLVRPVGLILNGVQVPASEQSFLAGQYPFVRPLLLVVDKAQMAIDGGLRESVLRYILSRDGQMEAIRAGFFPIDPAFIRQQLDQISGPQMR
ncbi:MAG: PstS family phosphate ABC transporter substrate-binding protein [Pirellula sp.]